MPRDLTTFPEIETPVDVGAERLRILADSLEREQPTPFNMMNFCMCALHHATTIPALRAAGLHMQDGAWPSLPHMSGNPSKGHNPFIVAATFFNLLVTDSEHLFTGASDMTPSRAAARIREHLARRSEIGGA